MSCQTGAADADRPCARSSPTRRSGATPSTTGIPVVFGLLMPPVSLSPERPELRRLPKFRVSSPLRVRLDGLLVGPRPHRPHHSMPDKILNRRSVPANTPSLFGKMLRRSFTIVLALAGLWAGSGCAVRPTARDDEASAQFLLLLFPSVFQPRLVAFHQSHGRWPRDMEEYLSFAPMDTNAGARHYFARCSFVPQLDGSLEVELPGLGGNPHRIRVPAPPSSNTPIK